MQDFIQFALHHWLLSGLFIILLILLLVEEARSKGLLNQISPQELVRMMNRESAVVVDIRNLEIFREGHIVGAVSLPAAELEKDSSKLIKYKDKPIVLVCATGQKAGAIAGILKKQNFEQIHVLAGGMNAWKTAQMPITKK